MVFITFSNEDTIKSVYNDENGCHIEVQLAAATEQFAILVCANWRQLIADIHSSMSLLTAHWFRSQDMSIFCF